MALAVQGAEQTDDNAQFVRDYLMNRLEIVLANTSLIDEEVHSASYTHCSNYYFSCTVCWQCG